jgi:hypothetical protein
MAREEMGHRRWFSEGHSLVETGNAPLLGTNTLRDETAIYRMPPGLCVSPA